MSKSYETIEFKSDVLKKMGPFKIIPKPGSSEAGTTGDSRAPVKNATKPSSSSKSKPPSYESLYPKLK